MGEESKGESDKGEDWRHKKRYQENTGKCGNWKLRRRGEERRGEGMRGEERRDKTGRWKNYNFVYL